MCMIGMNNCGVSCISLYKGVQQKVYFLHRDQFCRNGLYHISKVKVTAYFTQVTALNKSYHFDEKTN